MAATNGSRTALLGWCAGDDDRPILATLGWGWVQALLGPPLSAEILPLAIRGRFQKGAVTADLAGSPIIGRLQR